MQRKVSLGICLPMAGPGKKSTAPSSAVELRVEYLSDPIGIDVKQPRFFWVLAHPERGQAQSAYEVLVSRDPAVTSGEQWDSGKLSSNQSSHVVYQGKPLQSNTSYYWKARWWDSESNPGDFSQIARFDTGLFSPGDWQGQ